jgi:hypothetical protein
VRYSLVVRYVWKIVVEQKYFTSTTAFFDISRPLTPPLIVQFPRKFEGDTSERCERCFWNRYNIPCGYSRIATEIIEIRPADSRLWLAWVGLEE